MRIATRLKINIILSAAIVFIMSAAFMTAFLIDKKARDQYSLADELSRGMYDLNILTYYYMKHPEDRPREQWKIQYEDLSNILKNISPENGRNDLIVKMNMDLADLDVLFHELVASYEYYPPEQAGSGSRALLRAKQEQLDDLITLRLRSIAGIAARIAIENSEEAKNISRKIGLLFSVFAVMVLLLAVWFSTRIWRVIAVPVEKLREGIGIIRGGDLDHRIGIISDDEFGDLSRSFNEMTDYLKTTTVSRNELIHEITERTAKLEIANRELESFSYSVSHDLRSPLRAIEGFTRILEEDYRDRIDDEGKRIISVIVSNTRRMSKLIDDLLAFSRVGRYELKQARVNMEDMARSVFHEIVPPEGEAKTTFILHPLPSAFADASLIRQVWYNLLSNAVKFTSKKERAKIEIRGEVHGSDTIVYSVKDNGAGFDMTYADKLFGVFQRLHSVNEFEGTGIGLAIVRRIIERHGGMVWAEASPGQGAMFFFALPVKS